MGFAFGGRVFACVACYAAVRVIRVCGRLRRVWGVWWVHPFLSVTAHGRLMCYACGMRMRTCAQCGTDFDGRADAVTCSPRCRVARHRAASRFAPARMRRADRWVRQVGKRPIMPDGRAASSTDPETWSSFEDASRSDVGDGVGFVLNGDGVVCVDLDGCVEDGRLSPWAQDIVGLFDGAAVEVSLSGRGLHVWGIGPNVSKVFGVDGKRVEVYADKRYIAMTGEWMRRGDLVDLTDGLAALGLTNEGGN